MKGDGTELRACTPTPAPNLTRRAARGAGKGRFVPQDLRESLHLVQIWLGARPGPLRTRCGPVPAWFWILQEATYPLPRSYVAPRCPTPFSCGFEGSAASRPRGEPSGDRSLQDLVFLLPYRFRDAKIRARQPARLMPNPCDIFRGGPVRRSPASPRARARGRWDPSKQRRPLRDSPEELDLVRQTVVKTEF